MLRIRRPAWLALSVGLGLLILNGMLFATSVLAAPPPSATAPPQVSGPLPVSSTSYPWNAADHNVTPITLASLGYQEKEYLISGLANVYTYAGMPAIIQNANAPYTTRILVRRPVSDANFSGNVVVELLNPSYGFDLDFIWPASHEFLTARGDAWIGITIRPATIRALKQFDATRYASLSMANPVPVNATCPNPAENSTPTSENGLAFDIISQVGVLARATSGANPMAGLTVTRVYVTGYSTSANILQIYANAISPYASQPNGSPIFDGFLIGAPAGGILGGINQCASWIPPGDPHLVIQPNRSPVIRVNTMSDFGWYFAGPSGIGVAAGSTLNRRADSDAPNDRFREYEVPGATHLWTYPLAYMPGAAEAARIGASPVHACGETPTNNFPLQYILDGAFEGLDSWARFGTLPPRASRIALNNPGTYSETMVTDKYGNPVGGVRTPYVDLPRNTYVWYNDGAGCGSAGHLVPLPQSTITSLYPTDTVYESGVIDATFNLVAAGWVPELDGRKIILEGVHLVNP
jgi:Alpha/beta hydrolase domain